MYKIITRLLAVATILTLVACAISSPSVSYYTMQSEVTPEQTLLDGNDLAIALGPAEFPYYLQRNQIVTRQQNRLYVEEFHRWGGAFESTVLSVLGENIRRLLNTPKMAVYPASPRFDVDYRLTMDFLQFEGELGGELVMNVRWMIFDGSGKTLLKVVQTQLTHQMVGKSYEALVSSYNKLLMDLAVEVGQAVVILRKQPTL